MGVMNTTFNFLSEKGAFTGTWEDWERHLYDTWFGMYDRAKTILGSSGFEHVFIGECCKGGEVGGFHNWFHFYMLEAEGQIDYRGFMEHSLKERHTRKNYNNLTLPPNLVVLA